MSGDPFRQIFDGFNGWSCKIGPRDRGERHPVGESHAAAGPDDDVAARLEILDEQIEHARGHRVIDLEQRDRPVLLLPQSAIDHFQYGFGGVLRVGDRHFHVADDAEHVRGADAHAGKQLAEVFANHVFEHREPLRYPLLRRAGSATKRGSRSGTFTRANFVRPLCSTTTARFLLRFETSGNG